MAAAPQTVELLRLQAGWCARLGSPLYAHLLAGAADDAEAGGPLAALLAGHEHDRPASALALRLMGAVHRLVLGGRAPALAARYPSAGGDGDAAAAWPAFRELVASHLETLRPLVALPVQTNEVGRAAALAPGFLTVAAETGLPLRCLEVGASAGLNLRWDRFRYEGPGGAWGDPASPVVLRDCWTTGGLPFATAVHVAERAGCDPSPVDPTTDDGRVTLEAYVWADQRERFAQLDAACDVARRVPVVVERAHGPDWLAVRLAAPRAGVATVVYHSIVLQYLDAAGRGCLRDVIADAGARAAAAAPLAWLRLEPGGDEAELRLTVWPGGEERLLATAGFHGRGVRWLAPQAAVP
jgi:hypothetical protein